MINLTPSDTGKLARLSNGLVIGPIKVVQFSCATDVTIPGELYLWDSRGCPFGGTSLSIVEVLDMPAKKLTITKDDVGRWVKLRNGWIVGPIRKVLDDKAYIEEFGSFSLSGLWFNGLSSTLDIIAITDPPDQEDHA